MKYAYMITRNKKLVSVGLSNWISDMQCVIAAYSDGKMTYSGQGCYGNIIQHGSFTLTWWHCDMYGYTDIADVMGAAFTKLNEGGMIVSHNEV